MCIKYSFIYHASLLKVFQLFQFSFFQAKRVNLYEVHPILLDFDHQLQLNCDVFSTQLQPSTGNFCDIARPFKLFTPQYLRYDASLFYDDFHEFVISIGISMNSMAYSTTDTFFLPLKAYRYQLILFSLLRLLSMLILV